MRRAEQRSNRALNISIFSFILLFLLLFFLYAQVFESLITVKEQYVRINSHYSTIKNSMLNFVFREDFQIELFNFRINYYLYSYELDKLTGFVEEAVLFKAFPNILYRVNRLKRARTTIDNAVTYLENRLLNNNEERYLVIEDPNTRNINIEIVESLESFSANLDLFSFGLVTDLILEINIIENTYLQVFLIVIFSILLGAGTIILLMSSFQYSRLQKNRAILIEQLDQLLRKDYIESIEKDSLVGLPEVNKLVHRLRREQQQFFEKFKQILQQALSMDKNIESILLYSKNSRKKLQISLQEAKNFAVQQIQYKNDPMTEKVDHVIQQLIEEEDFLVEVINRLDERNNLLEVLRVDLSEYRL